MPKDSCRQCTKRRIICDKASPQCFKCTKKGIECSGVGEKYHFVEHSTSRVVKKCAPVKSGHHQRRRGGREASRDLPSSNASPVAQLDAVADGVVDVKEVVDVEDVDDVEEIIRVESKALGLEPSFPLCYTLETLKPEQRMLFDHFARVIAPYMVIIDVGGNGYRDLVLPLAHEDSLVQRAVSVVSAFHLGIKQPELRRHAEMGRAAILARLRQDAMSGKVDDVHTLSTWATLVVLLVGETVTGCSEFVHLFGMLRSLMVFQQNNAQALCKTSTFLVYQSRMFQLFIPPLLGATHPLEPWSLSPDPDDFFDFLDLSPTAHFLHNPTITMLKRTMKLAHTLITTQNATLLPSTTVSTILEEVRALVRPVANTTAGAHSLVWVYFVAAAESRAPVHRSFFSGRLSELFEIAEFGNIPVAMASLERIWGLGEERRWTREAGIVIPALVL